MDKKRKVIIIVVISLLLIALLLILWSNRKKILLFEETVKIIKETCSIDLTKLEVEYEYENTLRRLYEQPRHGSILVSFTCSPEYAEEVLYKFKDQLSERLVEEYDYGEETEELTEEEMEEQTRLQNAMEDAERRSMAYYIGIPEDEIKGKSLSTYLRYERPFDLSKSPCKCVAKDYIHVQELDNGDVTVYICYCE